MNNIKQFNEFFGPINEAVQSKAIDVENEQKKQSQFSDQIKIARNKMDKVDSTNKKISQKTQEKSALLLSIAKLTSMQAASMMKEAQAMQALSKEQANSTTNTIPGQA